MPPRRYALGAMREIDNELRKARQDEQDAQQRIKRLLAAQAALQGEPAPPRKHQRRLTRAEISEYLSERPGALAVEIAEHFGVPTTNVSSHLSYGKKDGQFEEDKGRWTCTKDDWN